MTWRRLLLRRVAAGLVAVWSVLTLVFLMFTVSRDWRLSAVISGTAGRNADAETVERIREEYLAARGLDRPLWEQYLDWMGNMATLQWGQSFETGEAVFPTVMRATLRTASYVAPALILAAAVGLAVGVYAAMHRGSRREAGARTASYLAFGLPNFWLGIMIAAVAALGGVHLRSSDVAEQFVPPSQGPFVTEYVLPALLVATTLTAAVVSYGRAYALRYASADLAKLVRAKGGGRVDVARHVLRNAAVPLVSLAFAETLALLALAVFVVEAVFAIDGLGLLVYNAVWTRDLPVLLGGAMVIVTAGVAGNVLQDLAYSALDPRVDTGSR